MKKNHIDKLLLLALFTLLIGNLYSQVSIRGRVTNIDGNPVEFASIQLLFALKYHQSALSDSLGNYYLVSTKKGDCELLINILGYLTVQKKVALKNDTIINFVLHPDTTILNEVTIIGQKDLIQAKSDRYVINIGGNIETKGKETTDILKQLPTINVSEQSLNIFGKSSVIVYINDRIVRLEGQSLLSYLNSLPPDIINSIEIISTPPAKYDAEGNVEIIKIITKRNILPGWKGYFKTVYRKNTYSSYMMSAFVNYTGEKMFFEGSINNVNAYFLNQSNYYIYFPDEITTTFNPKKCNYNASGTKASFGYNFNENSKIIIDFQMPLHNKFTMDDIENQTNYINPTNYQVDSIIDSKGKSIMNEYSYNSEVFYKYSFPNKKSYFVASTAFLDNYKFNSRSFISLTEIENTFLTTENFYTEGRQNYDIITSNIDFSFPLLNCNVNTGLKLSFINTSSGFNFFNVFDKKNILNPSLSNTYEYTEHLQAGYYSMEKSFANLSFKGGIRMERTKTTGKSVNTDEQPHTNIYIDYFPSAYLSYKFNSISNLSISYTARIERPPYRFLDPFRYYISKYDYAVGNPFLKPSYIKNLEFSYVHNRTLSVKLFYTDQNNKIGRYVVLDSLNILNQVQETDNFLNVNTYGINIYKLLKWNNWLETVLQADFAFSEYLSNKKELTDLYGIGSSIKMHNTIIFNKNLQVAINLEESFPGLYNYRNKKNGFRFDASINYSIHRKKLDIRLHAGDIFKTASPEYYYKTGGVKQVYKNYYDTRMLRLILTWKLGNWYNRTSKISTPSNIDEKQRL